MTRDEILAIFRETGTLKDGHFALTSGRHSGQFFLMSHTFQYPARTEELCGALAALFDTVAIDTVIGPAAGGIVLAYEVARQLGLRREGLPPRAIFTEKTDDGKMALKRQWSLKKGERVLVVEDAVTTGGSIQKSLDAVAAFEPEIVGVGCLADRSGGAAAFGVPFRALITLQVDSWLPKQCPLCREGAPLTRPKS